MEQYMKQLRQRHKLLSYFLGLGVIIFFNCFGFPIINLNKEWSMMLTAIKIYVVLGGALFSGGILAGLFPKKKPFFIITVTTLIISKKPGNTGISRDIRTEFTTDLLLSD